MSDKVISQGALTYFDYTQSLGIGINKNLIALMSYVVDTLFVIISEKGHIQLERHFISFHENKGFNIVVVPHPGTHWKWQFVFFLGGGGRGVGGKRESAFKTLWVFTQRPLELAPVRPEAYYFPLQNTMCQFPLRVKKKKSWNRNCYCENNFNGDKNWIIVSFLYFLQFN